MHLVQRLLPEQNGAQSGEDLIIVAVDAGKPEDIDDDIAREHTLTITRRLVMTSVGLRIVSYRTSQPQRLLDIIQRLRSDGRVNSVQANVAYRPFDPSEQQATTQQSAIGQQGMSQKSVPVRTTLRPSDNVNSKRTTRPFRNAPLPSDRIAVADVLAGGL